MLVGFSVSCGKTKDDRQELIVAETPASVPSSQAVELAVPEVMSKVEAKASAEALINADNIQEEFKKLKTEIENE